MKRYRIDSRTLHELTSWFLKQKRALPWRNDPTPYRVWVSEIMLQQTQVKTVLPYFEKFIARFPCVEDLALATLDEVHVYWAGLGYYRRATNLHRAAQLITSSGGFKRFGSTREEWLDLPGVGEYTVGAILSIAYGKPEAIVDGNVERVLSRIYGLSRTEIGDVPWKEAIWEISRNWIKTAFAAGISASHLNQGIMELGAMICDPRKPHCGDCPLAKGCNSFKESQKSVDVFQRYPGKKKRQATVEMNECVVTFVDNKQRVLVARARDIPLNQKSWRTGLWDFCQHDQKLEDSLKHLECVQFNYKLIVTHHRIVRRVQAYTINPNQFKKIANVLGGFDLHWLSLQEIVKGETLKVAIGAPVKKAARILFDGISKEG